MVWPGQGCVWGCRCFWRQGFTAGLIEQSGKLIAQAVSRQRADRLVRRGSDSMKPSVAKAAGKASLILYLLLLIQHALAQPRSGMTPAPGADFKTGAAGVTWFEPKKKAVSGRDPMNPAPSP